MFLSLLRRAAPVAAFRKGGVAHAFSRVRYIFRPTRTQAVQIWIISVRLDLTFDLMLSNRFSLRMYHHISFRAHS